MLAFVFLFLYIFDFMESFLSFCVFLCFEKWKCFCFPEECSSGTDWRCTGKSVLALPSMASQFRHAPSCSVQLFLTYDTSNMINWEENNSSQQPPIYTPLHLTHLKIKIVCVDEPAPIWLTTVCVFIYALIVYMTQWLCRSLHGQKKKSTAFNLFFPYVIIYLTGGEDVEV